jgi:hypothetical protein
MVLSRALLCSRGIIEIRNVYNFADDYCIADM